MKRLSILVPVLLLSSGVLWFFLTNQATTRATATNAPNNARSNNATKSPIAVAVAHAEQATFTDSITAIGLLQAIHDVPVVSETQGRVMKTFVNVGSNVRTGDALVQVDTQLKRSSLLAAEASYLKAKKDVERYAALHAEKNLADTELENARLTLQNAEAQFITAKRQLADATVRAPLSGSVTERPIDVGMMANPGTPVATIVDVSSLKLTVAVGELDVLKLRVGDAVNISIDAHSGAFFKGSIRAISAKANDVGAYPVEIVLPNSTHHPLKAGMTARVSIAATNGAATTQNRERATNQAFISIPRRALTGIVEERGGVRTATVFVVEAGTALARTVTLGRERGTSIEIASGLTAGAMVITSGTQGLSNGTAVTISSGL